MLSFFFCSPQRKKKKQKKNRPFFMFSCFFFFSLLTLSHFCLSIPYFSLPSILSSHTFSLHSFLHLFLQSINHAFTLTFISSTSSSSLPPFKPSIALQRHVLPTDDHSISLCLLCSLFSQTEPSIHLAQKEK